MIKPCPSCPHALKIIYLGLPGHLCEECGMMTGIASHAALLYFNGKMLVYEGSYWRGLWHWLFSA